MRSLKERVTTALNPLLECRDLTVEYPGVRALDGVGLTVCAGEIHALCGENGAGKSTLIKILGGVLPRGQYSGSLKFAGKRRSFSGVRASEACGIRVIHQELSLVPHLTIAENIFLGNEPGRWGWVDVPRMVRDSQKVLRRLSVDAHPNTLVKDLPIGLMQMVEIAKALHTRCRLLILDEPTSALSQPEVENLMAALRNLREQGTAIVYISHILKDVFALSDRVTVLRNGKEAGAFSTSDTRESEVVAAMVGRSLGEAYPERRLPGIRKTPMLQVKNLSMVSPRNPEQKKLRNISFEVCPGEIVGLAGLLGAGRSEILGCLFGLHSREIEGKMYIDGNPFHPHNPARAISQGIALVTEDRRRYGLMLRKSVRSNMTYAALKKFSPRQVIHYYREQQEVNRWIENLNIKTQGAHTLVGYLSGGNQQKVVLGKWLMGNPKVLLLDDPTRGVDVGAKAEIYQLIVSLAEKGLAVVLSSSEGEEVLNLAHRILVVHRGEISAELEGARTNLDEIMRYAAVGS